MITRRRARARPVAVRRGRVGLLFALVPLVGGLALGTTAANRSLAVSALSADDAEREGEAISIHPHPELAPGLAEVGIPSAADAAMSTGTYRLLALAPGAHMAAVAQKVGPGPADLILARADGSQLRVAMPGLLAATFAPDGHWLAALDGFGGLWRIGVDDGNARHLAAGPFIGEPAIEASGSILALRVPSVEAPFASRLLRVAADGSSQHELTREGLVYGVQPLDGGSLAVIAHRSAGTVVWRLDAGTERPMLVLGPDAVNVAVARAGDAVAFERGGDVFVQSLPAGRQVRFASAGSPRFAAYGGALLIETAEGSALVRLDGRTVAAFDSQAGFAACAAECRP